MVPEQNKIDPYKVTKPIQLLAAWLAGLIVINAAFLAAAVNIGMEHWASNALVVAAIINVPLFLMAIFLLQTKFRPELQEDSYYSKYLDGKSNKYIIPSASLEKDNGLFNRLDLIQNNISSLLDREYENVNSIPIKWRGWRVAVNDFHNNLDAIKQALTDAGINVCEYFGSTSIDPEPPRQFNIGLRNTMDFGACIYLLRQVAGLGFSGYFYFDEPREIDPDDVYLGPYGDHGKIIPINDDFIKLIQRKDLSIEEFRSYELKHI